MIATEYDVKLDELDRLLNDPDSKMEAARVWTLLAEISQFKDVHSVPDELGAQ